MPSTDRHWRWLLALALCLIIGPLLIYSDGALIGWGFAGVSPMDMFGAVR